MSDLTAVIVAAGSSRRMGFDKLTAQMEGRPVVVHAVAAFEACPAVGGIVLVTAQERVAEFRGILCREGFQKVCAIVAGGAERHASVWNGLQMAGRLGSEFVAVHDGARPLVTSEMILDCLQLARSHGAACCAAPISDTVKRATDGFVSESVERAGLWGMQTPQIFERTLILNAYSALMETGEAVTDEVSAVERMGKQVALLRNEDWNIKVTFPRDLELAAGLLQLRRARERRDAS